MARSTLLPISMALLGLASSSACYRGAEPSGQADTDLPPPAGPSESTGGGDDDSSDDGDGSDDGEPAEPSDPGDLDPQRLFECIPEETTYTSRRLWRLSGDQFVRAAASIAGSSGVEAPDPFGGGISGKTFSNYAEVYSLIEPELDTVLRAGRKAAIWSMTDKAPQCIKSAFSRLGEEGEPADPLAAGWFDEDCRTNAVHWTFEKLVRRPADDDEVDHYVTAMGEITQTLGIRRGIAASITLMFANPETVFRSELGQPLDDDTERYGLDAHELASALALTLSGRSARDMNIQGAASDGSILTEDGLHAVVQKLLTDDSPYTFEKQALGLLREYFHYDVGFGIQKDFHSDYSWGNAYSSLERFLVYLIRQDGDFVHQLLTSPAKMHYDDDGQMVITDDPSRPGILTRPGWLVSYSHNDHNDPIHRGYFIREQLLCQNMPEIPIGVIPQLPPDDGQTTLRERLAEHGEDASCSGCHALMDPLGLPFERFDHYGFYREQEAGKPVDTSGEIVGTQLINQSVATPQELVEVLGGSMEVERCFVRHMFRYVMGRDERYGDACTLAAAHEAYVDSGGSLRATMESLVTSETFSYRTDTVE